MLSTGKHIRLSRVFSHASGRLAAVAMDHFINYGLSNVPPGLRDIPRLLEQIVSARPDSITMHRGPAANAFYPHAGRVALILQSTLGAPDDSGHEQIANPEDAVRLGCDAFAICGFVRGASQMKYLKAISEAVQEAARFEMPVITHIYPRSFQGQKVEISYAPDDIAWAVRCAVEAGTDVVKVPYCGDEAAYAQIVAEAPVPVVAAGGPATKTFADALAMFQKVCRAGAKGAVVGRNVWGHANIPAAIRAMKSVIHDDKSPAEALRSAGISGT